MKYAPFLEEERRLLWPENESRHRRRTAEVKRKGSRRAIWIAGAVLAVLVAAWVGLCLYAGGYGGVFPGLTMAGEDLGGLSLDHAEEQLSEALEGFLTGRVVAVAADGEDLGTL